MIILETNAGLANRMRAVASAVSLAKEYNTGLKVIWPKNDRLNCDFYELFKPISDVSFRCSSSPVWKVSHRLAKFRYKNAFLATTQGSNEQVLAHVKAGENVYIHTFSQFYDVGGFACFQPVDEIEAKVESLLPEDCSSLVGVHIRRTDNEKSIAMSPTELFERAMEEEIERNPRVQFYLATDSAEDEKTLVSAFGSRIIVNETKELSRDSRQGIRDALVDLTCLSRSTRILGSYWSSFSETAAVMGGQKELRVISK